MNDVPSNLSGLQKEWSLLLHSFLDQSPRDELLLAKLKPRELTLEQVQLVKKDLSSQRKRLNQTIEFIKSEIEKLLSIIENLKLVGSDTEELHLQIEALRDQGEKIAIEMLTTEKKLKIIHDLKDRMLKLPDFTDSQ